MISGLSEMTSKTRKSYRKIQLIPLITSLSSKDKEKHTV